MVIQKCQHKAKKILTYVPDSQAKSVQGSVSLSKNTNKRILTKENILHLAKLSKLQLTDEEIEKYWKQLEETVEYVDNLNELDTTKAESTSQTTNLTNVTFEDGTENKQALSQEQALSNTKNKKDGYFIVKRIM